MELTNSEIVQEEPMDQDGEEEEGPRIRRPRIAAQVARNAVACNYMTGGSRIGRNSSTSSQIKATRTSGQLPLKKMSSCPKNLPSGMSIDEWCRLANISVEQNTKSRGLSDFRDDLGDYSPMYRYSIAQMIKLYCPKGVSLS